MKCVGKVSHLDSKNRAIIIAREKVPINTRVLDSENKPIGKVVDVFGPVREPYIAIISKKKTRITKYVGREVYRK